MTKKQLQYIESILVRIKDSDEHVAKALTYVRKDLAEYGARVGQLRDQYEPRDWPW